MIDVFSEQFVSRFVEGHVFDYARLPEFVEDVAPFGVGVRSRGVRHLEGESGKGEANVLCASADPKHAVIFVGAVGVEPETSCIDIGFDLQHEVCMLLAALVVLSLAGAILLIALLGRKLINRQPNADLGARPNVRY
jgi:hypothetical protein